MDQCIYATCCGYRCRRSHNKLRIQKRIAWDQLIAEHSQLIISCFIGNNRKCRHFTSCTCSCRDRNDRNDRSRYLVCTFIISDFSAVFCKNTNCLCHIHRTSATESYNTGCSCFFVCFCCFIYRFNRWICFHISKYFHFDTGSLHDLFDFLDHSDLLQNRSGDQKHLLGTTFLKKLRKSF